MAEEALETETPKKDTKADARDIESQIQTAMRSRVAHFKEQADSLTFEGVRRLLEKDLGLEPYALDVHKRFVKQCLLKRTCTVNLNSQTGLVAPEEINSESSLEGVGDDKSPKISGDIGGKGASTQEKKVSSEEIHSKKDVKKRRTDSEDKMEDSPVFGLLSEDKSVKLETGEAEGNGKNAIPSETIIKKAVRKRYSYVKANSEKVTMAGLRRLLEEDLKLEKFSLDPYKKLISQQLEEVLKSCLVSEPAKSAKKIVKKKPDAKATKKAGSEDSSDSSDQHVEEDEEQEDEIKPRKRSTPKGKLQNSLEPKKRKGSTEGTELSAKKRIKPATKGSEDSRDAEDPGEDSGDDQSQSSPEKISKKKEVSTPVYGKQVEHLKSVIKACGMSVPPVIYRRVKQAPDNKREAQLIKELEEILSREGLSSNPSEKEIKEVKRKKERAKELEGIDLSNIVSSSRRRSTTSFVVPPKAKEPVETKTNGNDVENSDDDNDDESNDGEEDEEDEEEENSGDEDDGSQSEELNEDEEGSD